MRHRNGGIKLGRNTSHRRAMLRNLVTSIILNDRVETTITKCKATRPIVEKMITLGKKGDLHSRRQAHAYLMTDEAVARLFTTVAPRYGARPGGYLRIVRTYARKGDAAEMAVIELLGVLSYIFVVGKLERVPEQRLSRRLAGMDWAAAPHRGVRYTNADSLTHASYMTRPIRRRGLDAHGGNALAPWV